MKKELWLSYLLAVACLLGPAGIHRFYLGRPVSGLLYLFTWGLFGIGTLVDLFTLPDMVAAENAKLLGPGQQDVHLHLHGNKSSQSASINAQLEEMRAAAALPPKSTETDTSSSEHKILQLAKKSGGSVTIAMVSLDTKLSMADAKQELERLRDEGFCQIDVTEEGAELYLFPGLGSNRPLLS